VISFLEGEVVEKTANRIVLAVGGVGYDVLVPTSVVSRLPSNGSAARVHTRMVVRDDAMVLYGFSTTDERALFDLLTGVSGVGPKVALSFLSALSADSLRRSVVAGDADALTVVPGVGKKVAQRVVVDLRDKLGGDGEAELVIGGPLADVREALLSLGLTPAEAGEALASVQTDGRDVQDLLREALQKVGR
jgi:holliday junction DNA helicase RuvA